MSDERIKFETFPGAPPERRGDVRMPSSIPAGIDGKRDLRHTALIHNASRTGALLATQHRCEPTQKILLTLHLRGPNEGEDVPAEVVRVAPLTETIWKFEVGVRFEAPLSEATLRAIEERARRTPGE